MRTISRILTQAVVCALPVLIFSGSTHAGTFGVFGPEDFVRAKGKPASVTRSFTVLNPSSSYTLRITNGGSSGEYGRVTSAAVWLNGAQVVTPNRLSRKGHTIAVPVKLATRNQLVVEVRGKPGSGFALQIVGADGAQPTITASVSPEANAAGWNNVDATVSFTCSDVTSGIASCSGPVFVNAEGAHQVVTGTAVDRAGNSASVSVTLNVDKTVPVLADFLPPDGDTEPVPDVTLTGTVAESLSGVASVTCLANGATEQAQIADEAVDDGVFVFSCNVPLVAGANLITVQANDVAGNASTSSLTINHALPPHVAITSPGELALTSSPVAVTGTVDDPTATVTVNDVPATISNGVFTASVSAPIGLQSITAVAHNVAGSGSDSVHVLVIFGTDPTVEIDSPSSGFIFGKLAVAPALPVKVDGWVRDNRPACLLIDCEPPVVTVSYNGAPVTATVSRGTTGQCVNEHVCWTYSATQSFAPPDGVQLSIEAEAQLGGGTASRAISGIVDFCFGDDNACDGLSLFQGHEQNRHCIVHSDGCSSPVFPGRKDDPTGGTLGLASTRFGQDEANLPQVVPTVFGQRRPIQLPCNRHDECYHQRCPASQTRQGMVDDKLNCNDRFFNDMNAVCQRAYPESTCPVSRIGLLNCPQWRAEKTACYGWARVYYTGVNTDTHLYIGLPPYTAPQTLNYCLGCPTIP